MKPVILDTEAEEEFRAAIDYYEERRAGLGIDFREVVADCLERIGRMPTVFPPYGDEGLRKCVMRRFPYSLFFLELDKSVWVAAVAHQRRRPDYWAHRKPPGTGDAP